MSNRPHEVTAKRKTIKIVKQDVFRISNREFRFVGVNIKIILRVSKTE